MEGQFAVDTMLFVTLQATWHYSDMSQAFHKVCMNLPTILKCSQFTHLNLLLVKYAFHSFNLLNSAAVQIS